MAAGISSGGKKPLSYEKSGVKIGSNWEAGKSGPKRRKNKGHKARTGKDAQRKATHHYGSWAKG